MLHVLKTIYSGKVVLGMIDQCHSEFSFQIFNAARQLSHIEAAPDKSGLVLLDYWVGLKWCLVIIHNSVTSPRHGARARPDLVRVQISC